MSHTFFRPKPSSTVLKFINEHKKQDATLNDLQQLHILCADDNNKLSHSYELNALISWMSKFGLVALKSLHKDATLYRQLRNELHKLQSSSAANEDEAKDLQIRLSLASLTQKPVSTTEYNVLAELCCSIGRLARRGFTHEHQEGSAELRTKVERVHKTFYGFGQTANCSHGGDIARYQKFLEDISLLAEHYSY